MMIFRTISFDPLNPSTGQWRGLIELDERINLEAENGWLPFLQWSTHDNGMWFFLLGKESGDMP